MTRKVIAISSEVTSLVLVPAQATGVSGTEGTRKALGLFFEYFGKGSATSSEWRVVCEEVGKLSRSTYYRARKDLVAAGYLTVQGKNNGSRYALSEEAVKARGDLSRIPITRLDLTLGRAG